MNLNKGTKTIIAAVIVVIAAVAAYSLFPYVVSTKITDLKTDQAAYIYGTVENRGAYGNISAFDLNDGSGTVLIVWNGTLPANGDKVLIHGTYKQSSFAFFNFSVFEANSVINWPI